MARVGYPVIIDDGFYYLQIAKNLARGLGSTFDGFNPTNGYHPLWVLALIPVFWLVPESPERAVHLALALQVLLSSATTVLIFHTARLTLGRVGATAAPLLWLLVSHRLLLSGVDLSITSLFVVATSWAYGRWFQLNPSPAGRRHYLSLGLLVGMSFLARLDNCFFIVVIGASLVIREIRRGLTKNGLVRLFLFALPLLPFCVGYLGVNFRKFGSIMPVSGSIKIAWSHQLLDADPYYKSYGLLAAKTVNFFWPFQRLRYPVAQYVLIGCFGYLLILLILSRRKRPMASGGEPSFGLFMRTWRFLFIVGLLQYSYYALSFHSLVTYGYQWYYVTQPIIGALLIGLVIEKSARWIGRQDHIGRLRFRQDGTRRLAMLLAIAFLFAVAVHTIRQVAREVSAIREQGLVQQGGITWIRQHTDPEAVIGAWNAGALGFFSGRRVVNLDGLVNSRGFYLNYRERLCAYWDKIGLEYVADVLDLENGPAAASPLKYTFEDCVDRLIPVIRLNTPGQPWSFQIFRFAKSSRKT